MMSVALMPPNVMTPAFENLRHNITTYSLVVRDVRV